MLVAARYPSPDGRSSCFASSISESISNYICNADMDIGIVDIDSDTVEASILVCDLARMDPTRSLLLMLLLML